MNVKFAFDYFDLNRRQGDDQLTRFSLGLEPFLAPNLQLRTFYRVYNGVPERPQDNFNQLIAEMHVFF
jgi:hypothetical protein